MTLVLTFAFAFALVHCIGSVLLSFEKVGCGSVHVNCLCLRRAILCFSGLLSFEKVGCGGVDVNCVCLRRGIFVFLRVVEF